MMSMTHFRVILKRNKCESEREENNDRLKWIIDISYLILSKTQ